MAIFKCKMCGGSLEINKDMSAGICEYCGTRQTLPKTDDEQLVNLINRANHFRQQCEFDKAMELYEKILNGCNDNSEVYWSLVLCRYGIEYVEDPATGKRVPTCHRTQYKSILDDADYISSINYSDSVQRKLYEEEAKYIDSIQKGILEISNKEKPFDVFICYKESDEFGNRTKDSVLAQDIYYQLVNEGFNVFFSRITLEDKLGTKYEPYIFAALNSAKVMVVVGTKPEYFKAVWVKNEWSRYLSIIRNDKSKMLIPAYKDMDPYDLPDELSYLQSLDMSKIGFIQDLIRGINKIIKTENTPAVAPVRNEQPAELSANMEAIRKRGYMALEDGDWNMATQYFEQILNQNAEAAEAYIGLVCAESQCRDIQALSEREIEKSSTPQYEEHSLCLSEEEIKDVMSNINVQITPNDLDKLLGLTIKYKTIGESREAQLKAEKEYFEQGRHIKRAFQFATGAQLEALNRVKETVICEMERRVEQAKIDDENSYNEVKKRLYELIDEEITVFTLRDQVKNELQKLNDQKTKIIDSENDESNHPINTVEWNAITEGIKMLEEQQKQLAFWQAKEKKEIQTRLDVLYAKKEDIYRTASLEREERKKARLRELEVIEEKIDEKRDQYNLIDEKCEWIGSGKLLSEFQPSFTLDGLIETMKKFATAQEMFEYMRELAKSKYTENEETVKKIRDELEKIAFIEKCYGNSKGEAMRKVRTILGKQRCNFED